MDALDCIKSRRSIRKFTDEAVSEETLEAIVAAAAYAPSWKNTQTTRYIAVTDPEVKAKIAGDCVLGFPGNTRSISAAPMLIVLTTVNGRSGYERDGSFATQKQRHWKAAPLGIL
jgi:nitroreductase